MQQYIVTGMTCAACQNRVEKAVSKVPGVTSCSVSLLTNSMGVEGTAKPEAIIQAVTDAGYGASQKGAQAERRGSIADDEDALKDRETPKLRKRLIASVGFLIVLMYITMGHMMWGAPIPKWFEGNHVALGIIELLLAAIVMIINQKFFTSGFKSLWARSPNMDTLVAMGSSVSFVWSVYVLLTMCRALSDGDMAAVMDRSMNLYFETAAMIPTLITVGKMLEAMSKGRTTNALKSLMKLAPETAVVLRDGVEAEVPIAEVAIGDIVVVRPGQSIPVDAVVIEGSSAVNEAALTGESIPVDKTVGDQVSAATINQSGFIKARATRVGEDTTLSQIIHMVSDAAATKAPIARIADKVSGVFVPAVLAIAAVTLIVWLLTGHTVGAGVQRSVAVLVISCPCALGLATPVAIMVGNGMGAKNGILYKTAVSQEEAGRIDIIALDKTGTITSGEPVVTDIVPARGFTEEELLQLAADLEQRSEHPLAKAIMAYAEQRGVPLNEVEDFKALPGNGLTAKRNGAQLFGGSVRFMTERFGAQADISDRAQALAQEGKTPLFFAEGERLAGVIAVADAIKEDSPQAVRELQNMGIEVVMLTGDNERTANAIGAQAGVDRVIAGVLPDGKDAVIRELQKRGKVAMVGDGINDAPALTRADLGIAIGAGADVAIDAADIVLMKSRLTDVSAAIRLSRATIRNIHENLFWAFFYNVICIPLAAGLYSAIFGWSWEMNPMIGAAAMSLSSFCVCMNALRLNLFKVHDPSRDKARRRKGADIAAQAEQNITVKENENMKKTLTIEGMMCGHCEATVKKALEAIDGVESAQVSHEAGTAVVELSKDVDNAVLTKAVEDRDYTVKAIA